MFNYFYKTLTHRCYIHDCDLQIWSGPRNKYEYGLIEGHIECPECHPGWFKDYIEDLDRFDMDRRGFTEQCFCPSYFDDDNVLRDCTCGKCK